MANEAKVIGEHQIELRLDRPAMPTAKQFRLTTKDDPDIPLAISTIQAGTSPQSVILTTGSLLESKGAYQLTQLDTGATWQIAPSLVGIIMTTILAAALIQNFVFTRYLGLCVFFGVSRKRETALGMGITFTIVGLLSGLLSWFVDRFVLQPFKLDFLEIIVFIGIVACLVQMVDTIMKKVHRSLHQKFGIYVVLITTNCIILAVPLLNAMNETGFWPSLALALGSGLGFALALFLMSSARERTDLAPVPPIFQGLPIAFILAGLFALAFLGFSGLKV